MGNAESGLAGRKLSKELPGIAKGADSANGSSQEAHFVSEKERERFIGAVIAVLTNNGKVDISECEFKLIYNKRDDEKEQKIAALIAIIKDESINSKIQAEHGGDSEGEAFRALVQRVDAEFDKIIASVPDLLDQYLANRQDEPSVNGGDPPAYS